MLLLVQGRKFSKPRQLHRRVAMIAKEQNAMPKDMFTYLRMLANPFQWRNKDGALTLSSSVRLDTGKQIPEQSLSFLTNHTDLGISDVGQITRNNPYWALAPFLLQSNPSAPEVAPGDNFDAFKDHNDIQRGLSGVDEMQNSM